MIGTRKRFDKDLFLKSDPKSRKVVKDYYKKKNIILKDNPNKFGPDLISEDNKLQFELEHRPPWIDKDFPFADVNILARKHYLKEGTVSYIILSRDFKRIGIVKGKVLKEYINDNNIFHHRNKNVPSGEYVYKIPVDKFKWITV